MKNALYIYNLLLKHYPHCYRKEFGAQMMQTFIDHYEDVEKLEGRVGVIFWLSVIADEIENIIRQHLLSLREGNNFLKVTVSKVAVSAALLLPLYAVFYALLIKASLALPHPPISGIGVMIALVALLLLPGVLSIVVSYVLASAFANVFARRAVQ